MKKPKPDAAERWASTYVSVNPANGFLTVRGAYQWYPENFALVSESEEQRVRRWQGFIADVLRAYDKSQRKRRAR